MCRQFLWRQEENSKAVQKIMGEIQRKLPQKPLPAIAHPSGPVAYLLVSLEGVTTASIGQWGFRTLSGKVIYNARQETVLSKGLFARCFQNGRCLVPAHSFYEWDQSHQCNVFSPKEDGILYFAGLYREMETGTEIVIITTHSRGPVEEVHHRMPLILDQSELRLWLYDEAAARNLLSRGSIALKRKIVEE